MGWSSNWQYAETVPTGSLEGWRSSMSLPRRNFLINTPPVGWNMLSYPYDLSSVLGPKIASNSSLNNGTLFVDYSTEHSNALYFEANVTGINTTTVSGSATFNFTFYSPVSQEYLSGGFFFGGFNNFFIDRGGVRGFDDVLFTDKFSTEHLINENGSWSVTGVIDRSIFEVFIDGGQHSATTTFFPTEPLTKLIITTADLLPSMSVSVAVYSIKSAWLQYENEQETVFGNTTNTNLITGQRHMVYDAGYGAVD
jgi:beta-fructofuranosidase